MLQTRNLSHPLGIGQGETFRDIERPQRVMRLLRRSFEASRDAIAESQALRRSWREMDLDRQFLRR
jgi:hypothetical protein